MSGLAPLGAILRGEAEQLPSLPPLLALAVRCWPAAVGELVAREAWPARIQGDGTLVVHCASSVWASELSHLSGRLRESLEREGLVPAPPLRFMVGPVPRRAPEPAPAEPPAPLDEADERRVSAWVSDIVDPTLRDAAARAARAGLQRRAAMRKGGAPTERFASIHAGNQPL
jgi:hypothetical protein